MAIENLKQNVEMIKKLVKEILHLNLEYNEQGRSDIEKELIIKQIVSDIQKLKIINNSIPEILDAISLFKKLSNQEEKVKTLVKISYIDERKGQEKVSVTLNKKDKEKYLRELDISKITLKRLRKGERKVAWEREEFRKPNFYAKLANKLFFNQANKYFVKGKLQKLNSNLRKANMVSLVTTYFSMTLLTSLFALIFGIILAIVLLILMPKNLVNIIRNLLIIFILPVISFLALYFYPYAEAKSIENRINQELPFVVLHMSAVAGSGIEPTQIFKIIALGREYKNTSKEFKKIVNQVNVYGYDLITALKNTARETSSDNLSELLNGMATTISGGGSLTLFFEKRAETLLFSYKLDKERRTKSAEAFMDIYISIVIAAPMIMMLLLILISISGMSIGLSLGQLSLIVIASVALINIIFLSLLHLGQSGY